MRLPISGKNGFDLNGKEAGFLGASYCKVNGNCVIQLNVLDLVDNLLMYLD